MGHQNLTDGTARWFDSDQAERFDEATEWDGNNHISIATGSQWDHETLYRTAQGLYILHFSSQYQGRRESWTMIEPEEAHGWLVRNGHQESVPAEYLSAQEV